MSVALDTLLRLPAVWDGMLHIKFHKDPHRQAVFLPCLSGTTWRGKSCATCPLGPFNLMGSRLVFLES